MHVDPLQIEQAIRSTNDESSFIQELLIRTLEWPLDESAEIVDDITYEWTTEELGTGEKADKRIAEGRIRQLQPVSGCPWGIFIVEFNRPDVLGRGRGMTGALRAILRGLVSRNRREANLPSFLRENLLFICTHEYKHFRFAYFKDPGEEYKRPPLASFGWGPGDPIKTVSKYNLPHLTWPQDDVDRDAWTEQWSEAFDVERVTKKFYIEFQELHERLRKAITGIDDESDRKWYASVLLNCLMFIYFLQKKGFIDGGDENYLEQKFIVSWKAGDNQFYSRFLMLLFFEGFAKPFDKRSDEAKEALGDIRYLNGGLFLKHAVEQRIDEAGGEIRIPNKVFDDAFKLFAGYSWNLNDTPGGQENEINPDILGYIFEKYINEKAFGAFYTRPAITEYLCERTIHRLILDGVLASGSAQLGFPKRDYKSLRDLLENLDSVVCKQLLDDVLPNLSLLDPACGSGAFLVASMKTLIDIYLVLFGWVEFKGDASLKRKVRNIRKDHASIDYYIKKQIITDNLFGVDIMEEAAETAQLRLFLALVAAADHPGDLEPLPNIDFNILAGNSLIGLLHIEPTDFDKKGGQGHLLRKTYRELVEEKNALIQLYRSQHEYRDDLMLLRDRVAERLDEDNAILDDLLLDEFRGLGIKYEEATWDDAKNKQGRSRKRSLQIAEIRGLTPFHWGYQFDSVMSRGGFDAIITNPPWEVFKPNGKEFFQGHSNLVKKKKMSIHDFQKHQKDLLKDKDVRRAWLNYLSGFPHQSKFYRSSTDYSHQLSIVNGRRVGSDINLYKLFIERCFRLLRQGGQCGIIVQSGIYTDLGTKHLRKMLFEECELKDLFGLSNERFIFDDVHHAQKFCILVFSRGGETTSFRAAFRINPREAVSSTELREFFREDHIQIEIELIRRLSPNSMSVMEFKSEPDVKIAKKISRFPLLGEEVECRWSLSLGNEFHMTGDSDLFLTEPKPGALPLYEGKMIWQFDHQFAEPRYWVDESAGKARARGARNKSKQVDEQCYRLGHRSVASSTNERTMLATILPPGVFFGHSINAIVAPMTGHEQCFVTALLNSVVFDWYLRLTISANVTQYFIYETPVPRLTEGDPGFAEVVERAGRLICTTNEFDELAAEIGLDPPNRNAGVTDPKERARLRAELDGMIAHLYGLTEGEFAHILSSFPLVEHEVKDEALDAYRDLVKSGMAKKLNPEAPEGEISEDDQQIMKLIAEGESATVEFKSSARWDYRSGKQENFIEQIIVKTVAAFLNTDGGTLLIGVNDDGDLLGLEPDLKTLGKKRNLDGYELFLMNLLLKEFGRDASSQIRCSFHEINNHAACRMLIRPSPKPRWVTEGNDEKLYIRTGNATNHLKPSEIYDYIRTHFERSVEMATKP